MRQLEHPGKPLTKDLCMTIYESFIYAIQNDENVLAL